MKKLTKKSLDELAKTMNVIPEAEQDYYWGMYDPASLKGTQQNVGMGILNALKYYESNSSSINYLGELVDLDSGNFGSFNSTNTTRWVSGTFTFQGYTYKYNVANPCAFHSLSDDCTLNNISGSDHLSGNSGYALRNNSGNILSITTNNSAANTALLHYLYGLQ